MTTHTQAFAAMVEALETARPIAAGEPIITNKALHKIDAALALARGVGEGELQPVGWLWHSQGGALKLTTWHPDTQAETAERIYRLAALQSEGGA